MASQAFIIATDHRIIEAIEAINKEVDIAGKGSCYSENSDLWDALGINAELLVSFINLYHHSQ